jgi:NADH-quinone oxidoreductase subunit A
VSFAIYCGAVVVLVAMILVISRLLGQSHHERATGSPYESGMMITGSARGRRDVSFFLLAVFFVIFDLEAVFIFGWAVAIREVGWSGYVEILIFIGVLLATLLYLWRVGGLEVRVPMKRGLNRPRPPVPE